MCSVDQLINKQTNVCPLDDQKHAEHSVLYIRTIHKMLFIYIWLIQSYMRLLITLKLFYGLYLLIFCRYRTDGEQGEASRCVHSGRVQRRSGSGHRLPGSSGRHQRGGTHPILIVLRPAVILYRCVTFDEPHRR